MEKTKGKQFTTTKTQLDYLAVMEERGTLKQGYGGYSSTLTIRILEERGLCTTGIHPGNWAAQITNKGRELLRTAGK